MNNNKQIDAPEAKQTNVFVDKKLGDNSWKVTYLGGRGTRFPENKTRIERRRPIDQPLEPFYGCKFPINSQIFFSYSFESHYNVFPCAASYKQRIDSEQGLAWKGSGQLRPEVSFCSKCIISLYS